MIENVSTNDLATVLDLTPRRIRQLAEDGIFPRAGRGMFPLAACVQSYIGLVESRTQPAELLRERVRLIRAQARRVELENAGREGTKAELDGQDAIVSAAMARLFIRLSPVSSWLHAELSGHGLPGDMPRVIAGAAHGWIVGARAEIESELHLATSRARRRGHPIRDYQDLQKLIGREIEDVETDGETAVASSDG